MLGSTTISHYFFKSAGVKVRKTVKPGEAQYAAEIIFSKSFLDASMFLLKIHEKLSSWQLYNSDLF